MKFVPPVSASMRLAGAEMMVGANGAALRRDLSDMLDNLAGDRRSIIALTSDNRKADNRRAVLPLQQLPGVVEDQPVLVDIGAVVGARNDIARTYVEAL